MYVYSLGATLSVALESTVGSNTSHLYQLLAAMMSSEPSKRPSLQSVMDTSARQSAQGGANEINTLVTFVLDTEQHVSVTAMRYNTLVQSVLAGIIWW